MMVLRDLREIEERDFFTRWVTSASHGTMGRSQTYKEDGAMAAGAKEEGRLGRLARCDKGLICPRFLLSIQRQRIGKVDSQ
jgi:hypothetical protein